MNNENKMIPFVKWVGGKRQLIKKIEKYLPNQFNAYHEPFVGGGALFFHLNHKKAFISDMNKELINTYKVIKNNYRGLREYLLLMEYGNDEKGNFFKKIRAVDRNDPNDGRKISSLATDKDFKPTKIFMAARFIYLNKAGFNGMYRVNSKGEFNVPFNKKKKIVTHEYPNLKLISDYLKNNEIIINNYGFEKSLKNIKKGDFVYLDPPYDYEKGIKGFDSYQKESFGKKGQEKLAKFCHEIHKRGAYFMLSNHNTKLIQELYKNYNIKVIKAKRLIGGKGASRKDVEEVLVMNYEIKK